MSEPDRAIRWQIEPRSARLSKAGGLRFQSLEKHASPPVLTRRDVDPGGLGKPLARIVQTVLGVCREKGILGGVALGRWFEDLTDCVAVAVTEKRTRDEIDALVDALDSV